MAPGNRWRHARVAVCMLAGFFSGLVLTRRAEQQRLQSRGEPVCVCDVCVMCVWCVCVCVKCEVCAGE